MNKKLLTAALSATLVLGFGAQNAYAANQTIPADVGNQTVNTTTGGVAGTEDSDKELTKTDSTLDSKVTPADGGTKVFPAKNEKETNAEGNKETTPADGDTKVFPAKNEKQMLKATKKQPQQTATQKYSQQKAKKKQMLKATKKQLQQTAATKYSQPKKTKIKAKTTKK